MSALPTAPAPARPRSRPASRRGQRADLRLVGPPRHTARFVVGIIAVAGLGVVGVVSLSALAAEAAFEAGSLQERITELTVQYDELTAEVAALEAPERIRAVAESEFGMTRAPAAIFVDAAGAANSGRGDLARYQVPVPGE